MRGRNLCMSPTIPNDTMKSMLSVPRMPNQRRRSEGSLGADLAEFQSNQLKNTLDKKNSEKKEQEKSTKALMDWNLIEVLRKNYDIVSALADIDHENDVDSLNGGGQQEKKMVRGANPPSAKESPRPLILRNHNPYKYESESPSISSDEESIGELPFEKQTFLSKVKAETGVFFNDIQEAFKSPRDTGPCAQGEITKLSANALRKDIKRCYNAIHPFVETAAALYDLLLWKSPVATLLLMLVYVYGVYRGWLTSLVLLLLWFQLSLNYLKTQKNIDIGLCFLPRKDVAMPKFDMNGAQLIFDIARLAQRLLRFAADFLEKLGSLLTWKDPKVSWTFYCLVIYWLTLSVVFTTGTCLGMCALALGVRIFITTYLFERFPRLRFRLDTFGYFYRNLPVKETITVQSPLFEKKQHPASYSGIRVEPPSGRGTPSFIPSGPAFNSLPRRSICNGEIFTSKMGSNFNLSMDATTSLSRKSSTETEILESSSQPSTERSGKIPFSVSASNLSLSEQEDETNDLSSVEEDPMIENVLAFRSCVMNDKMKTFPKSIYTGVLYLTDSALIFKFKKGHEERNKILFLFDDITMVRKISSLRTMSLIAGTRKSIEIVVEGREKPLHFIGVAKRDDFVIRLQEACVVKGSETVFVEGH